MELNAVSTRRISKAVRGDTEVDPPKTSQNPGKHSERVSTAAASPETALETLKSKPDQDELLGVLRWLEQSSGSTDGFNIQTPGPKAAQLIYSLVNDIVCDFWDVLSVSDGRGKKLLVKSLSSVAALGAITSRIRLLLDQAKNPRNQETAKAKGSDRARPLATLLEVLESVLKKSNFASSTWQSIQASGLSDQQKTLQWKEFLSLVAAGRVLSTVAEANYVVSEVSEEVKEGSWLGDGSKYATWLGRNVQHMVKAAPESSIEGIKAASQVLSKGMKLGHVDSIIQAVFADILGGSEESFREERSLVGRLSVQEQKTFLYAVVRVLEKRYLSSGVATTTMSAEAGHAGNLLGAVAALISAIIRDSKVLKDFMIEWLASISAEAIRHSHLAHRAVIMALSSDTEAISTALRKAMELFGDKLYIKHTPIFQQEINTQVLLLLIGYVHRLERTILVELSKSSLYLNGISNHLASTSPRARFLGMVVGTAVSDLVDSKDKRMNFSSEDMETKDGQWYRSLTGMKDRMGTIQGLVSAPSAQKKAARKNIPAIPVNAIKNQKRQAPLHAGSKVISIEEVEDNSSEEDDLPTYAKPHSDPEDSEEDPELIQRNKPAAPVYIRDLLMGLRDLESYDRHRLALSSASSLIRRKAAFGTEVTDSIEELATILVGLNDKYELDNFQRWRLQAMIAVLVADPTRIGPWFARAFYNGEYSISQRASVLTTLGLGAREIAGLGKEDEAMTGSAISENAFPSKRLPEKLHNHYAQITSSTPKKALPSPAPTPIDTLSSALETTMIAPLAANAADAITGPNALKVRTFSSRMAVEKNRAKPTPNPLAKILASSFFFPLVGRWSIHLQTHGDSTTTTSPYLLSHLLRTLALILHAGGATSPSLPQITGELWALLLSVRARATEGPVLEALLFAVLTLLEVNTWEDRRVAEEHAKELLETQSWVEGLFERIGGGSAEDEKVRMLAAGVLLRCREVVEKYQRLLMGDLVDYM